MKRILTLALLAIATFRPAATFAAEEETPSPWTFGVSAQAAIPQGGTEKRASAGAAVRVGRYLTENWAFEGEVGCFGETVGLAAVALGHLQGWDVYGDLFGYSRFDPFVTVGARGWLGREGQVGPQVGLGAFYHLTDNWALCAAADATLGLDTQCEMLYSLSAGVRYSF